MVLPEVEKHTTTAEGHFNNHTHTRIGPCEHSNITHPPADFHGFDFHAELGLVRLKRWGGGRAARDSRHPEVLPYTVEGILGSNPSLARSAPGPPRHLGMWYWALLGVGSLAGGVGMTFGEDLDDRISGGSAIKTTTLKEREEMTVSKDILLREQVVGGNEAPKWMEHQNYFERFHRKISQANIF